MEHFSADIGFVFALRQEAVGMIDRLNQGKKTQGNGWTFHTGKIGNVTAAVVLSGAGQKKAEDATNILIDVFQPKRICSVGYAGGLSLRLKRLNICVPEQVIRESDNQTLDLSTPIPRKTLPVPNRFTLLTANDVVALPKQKRNLHEQTGAELVDMETFAVADVCRIRQVSFFSFRIILDAVDDRLPKDITKILDGMNKGMSRLSGTILGGIWSRPSIVIDFVTLKKRAFLATERLTRFTLAELQRRQSAEIPSPIERITHINKE